MQHLLRDVCSIPTKDGHIALTGNLFTKVKNGVKESREITDEEAMRLIKDEFGLII